MFTHADLEQIKTRGTSLQQVLSQIDMFRKGFPHTRLDRPCTVGDGISVLSEMDLDKMGKTYSQAALAGRAMKFVPASGAATRMFKFLLSVHQCYEHVEETLAMAEAEKGDSDTQALLRFIEGIDRFAFYEDLRQVMSRDGLDVEELLSSGQYKSILEYLLTAKGLDLAHLPKGLIKFHDYPDHNRTPFEEQLVEAASYIRDAEGIGRVHFTVPVEHERTIRKYLEDRLRQYAWLDTTFQITLSVQRASTDTIAVDMDNAPFRDQAGRLLFRPAGHGALLENLNELRGDIVFIKNIDNVVPDRRKQEICVYKRALGGYLVELQEAIFSYTERLLEKWDDLTVKQCLEFVGAQLSVIPPEGIIRDSRAAKREYLLSKLNRPLRVCGMVKNEGEPGGGPFWIRDGQGGVSLQIVESAQVDMSSSEQRSIWETSTHFNPVDLVCGVRDYLGRPMNLLNFSDPESGFISIKSQEGRELKALELPGLWNGSMAHWNTVFVEVPGTNFNPVKTVLDLLREAHQPKPNGSA
jgi:hypothetical protein